MTLERLIGLPFRLEKGACNPFVVCYEVLQLFGGDKGHPALSSLQRCGKKALLAGISRCLERG